MLNWEIIFKQWIIDCDVYHLVKKIPILHNNFEKPQLTHNIKSNDFQVTNSEKYWTIGRISLIWGTQRYLKRFNSALKVI